MNGLIPSNLLDILISSTVLGVIVMAIIQKFKTFECINNSCYIWLLNIILSLGLAIPFSMCFYNYDLLTSFWVGIFSCAEAPTIYDWLKKQNLIGTKANAFEKENEEEKVKIQKTKLLKNNKKSNFSKKANIAENDNIPL